MVCVCLVCTIPMDVFGKMCVIKKMVVSFYSV